MAIDIKALECNLASNQTTVTFDITEQLGPITRVKETMKVVVEGKFTTIDDAVVEQVIEVLEANGVQV